MKTKLIPFVIYGLLGCFTLLLQSVIEPVATNGITQLLTNPTNEQALRLFDLLVLFCLCIIGMPICDSLSNVLKEVLEGRYVKTKTMQLMRKILFTSNDYFLKNDPESIVNTMSHDIETYAQFFITLLLDIPLIIIGLMITIATMYCGSWSGLSQFGFPSEQKGNVILATIVLVMIPLRLAFLLYDKKVCEYDQIRQDASNGVIHQATESIRGIVDIRSANAFSFILNRIGFTCARFYKARIKMSSLITVLNSISGIVSSISEIVLLSICALLIYKIFFPNNNFHYADYTGFVVLAKTFNMYAGRAIQCAMSWQTARPSLRRIAKIKMLPDAFGPTIGETISQEARTLSFEHVSLTLQNGTELLSNISFTINRGEHVALVGPSGCGKTTLLKMVMRHLSPTSGSIKFGSQAIESLNFASYARKVAYVSQRPFIFNGTIRENILAGRNESVSNERLLEILDDVVLSADLKTKDPDINMALDFELHSEGRELSGGQMAKIALARAMVGNPDIYLLDEVTAPLDELAQHKILNLFATKYRDKTVVAISHRIPAMRNSDRIIVMNSGRIVQDGNFDKLSNEPGLFAKLLIREEQPVKQQMLTTSTIDFENNARGTIQALSLCSIFSGLSAALLSELIPHVKHVSVAKGTYLFRKGDPGDSLLIIQTGTVEINKKQYGPGTCFGEIAVFYGGIRTADILAVSDCNLICISRDTLLTHISKNPNVAISLLQETARIAVRESKVNTSGT